MKILLITLLDGGDDPHHHSIRVIEDPTEEELQRIVAVNGVFSSKEEKRPELEDFHKWMAVETKEHTNWGFALGDAGLLYGPFDYVVICGG
jgi:hypothetical protein